MEIRRGELYGTVHTFGAKEISLSCIQQVRQTQLINYFFAITPNLFRLWHQQHSVSLGQKRAAIRSKFSLVSNKRKITDERFVNVCCNSATE